jgi:hypothetical protein
MGKYQGARTIEDFSNYLTEMAVDVVKSEPVNPFEVIY